MGLTKRRLDEAMEGGYWTPPDWYVCHRCVTHVSLKVALKISADAAYRCSYCCLSDATNIAVLLKEISDAIGDDYSGGGIFEELGPWTDDEDLSADVEDAFSERQSEQFYPGA